MKHVRLTLEPLPLWLDPARLLGRPDFESEPIDDEHRRVSLVLSGQDAADLGAQLRGLGFDGRPLRVETAPALDRSAVREARLREARARRETTPGFVRPGARASGEGRYSLTPESLALELGELAGGVRVVDACCGSGGNAIGFARAGCSVTALEVDPQRLDEARHNAALYGVSQRIAFVQGDALEALPKQRADILFVDPPWGEQYDKRATTREDFPLLSALLELELGGYGELWLKLPSSFCVASVARASASAWFGRARGDVRRVKFVLLRVPAAGTPHAVRAQR